MELTSGRLGGLVPPGRSADTPLDRPLAMPGDNVLFAGGGSLGAIYPALTIANRLAERIPGFQATIAGDGRAIERHTVRGAGWQYVPVLGGEASAGRRRTAATAAADFAGWIAAHWLLREEAIDLVVSLGGSTSGPIARAACESGVPVVVVESNALPSPSTWRLTRRAHAVCLAHEETGSRLPFGCRRSVTGAVARPCFDAIEHPPTDAPDNKPTVVVLGGAAGAQSLNLHAPAAFAQAGANALGWRIVHQTGERALLATESRYREAGVDALVVSYIDELADVAAASDLVVCRPGGPTLAETALAGLPAVLVPDARRRDSVHQANADLARLETACPVVDERAGRLEDSLAAALAPLLSDPDARAAIGRRMKARATPRAADAIADVCCEALGLAASEPERRAAA